MGFFYFLLAHSYYPLNMLKIKRDINQQDLKIFDHHFVNNFHSSCGSRPEDTKFGWVEILIK